MTLLRRRASIVTAALLVIAAASDAAIARPLRIAYPVWVGNGPLFVAI
jgi:multidrug transporter EmrE-like cation transporter